MKIVCYGDSNTFGFDPRDFFGECYQSPWPWLLSQRIGWNVQNLGENGREIPKYPVNFPTDMDFLIVMLGTNDLLQGNAASTVAKRMETFLERITAERSKILLVAPPILQRGEWVPTQTLIDMSQELSIAYQAISQRMGIRFVDAASWNIPLAFDGVHFTEEGHRAFAKGLYHYLIKEGL